MSSMSSSVPSGLSRLDDWLTMNPKASRTIALAGGRIFVRLMVPNFQWRISPKDFPTDFTAFGRPCLKSYVITAMGYGYTIEEALDEAFSFLPG